MAVVALVLYVAALVVIFGIRSWVQHRRTGSTGFRGFSGTPATAGWWGGVLFVLAVVLGLAGPHPRGDRCRGRRSARRAAGRRPAPGVGGFAAAGWPGRMGASWRVGVDPDERTTLVTTGVFGAVRNPVFSAMVAAQAGISSWSRPG